ncbi:aldolase/citrate lyase family protein [Cryptosporangium arvum]|uniref:2,4-dihydroxyhept-2-ene-1,7-dioic acid aldolase n=1 Tax=Cryptosporangium arvum DSM 44712 TaxID=927661 RepID=A0A010YHH3_9ACTN|nr:aldolase/citrate lyase family protein [Cryptosporangium arvum]EXG79720.1 2,4-dihydroxyhept-2-ene-1,7-dioic acid aldolase [Cryptosporangium arvum DSM 44712]
MSARARLRAALSAGRAVRGTFVKLAGEETVDVARAAGVDFVVVDLEHSQLSEEQARRAVSRAAAIGLPALVRIPTVDSGLINRLLEAGAVGLQLSTLRSAAETRALIGATRYAPAGTRSISLAHPGANYSGVPLADYLATEHETPPLLVGQIETATTDDPLPDVVEGLDVAFLGVTDLAVSVGLDDEDAIAARVAEIRATAAAAGVIAGSWAVSPDAAGDAAAAGDRYLVVGSDLQFLAASMRKHFAKGAE